MQFNKEMPEDKLSPAVDENSTVPYSIPVENTLNDQQCAVSAEDND